MLIAPTVVLAGWIYHPYLAFGPDSEAIAADTTRWGIAHLLLGAGFGLMVLAFLTIRNYVREVEEKRWIGVAIPFIVVGGSLSIMLPGMEFAPLAVAETGSDVRAAQEALASWFIPVLLTSGISYALGVIMFAIGIIRSRVVSSRLAWFVASALIVMVVSRFVPFGAASDIEGVLAVAALWPLAFKMVGSQAPQRTGEPQLAST